MKRKLSALLMAAAMLVYGAGCGNEDSSITAEITPADSSSKAVTVSSAAPEALSSERSSEADSFETEQEPALPPMTSAAQELSCLDVKGAAGKAVSSADNKIAVSCRDGEELFYYIADPAADKLLSSGKLRSDNEEIIGLRPDGTLITAVYSERKILFYPPDGGEARAVSCPENMNDLTYDHVNDRIIGRDRGIITVDADTGEAHELVPPDGVTAEILDIDNYNGIYAALRRSTDLGGSKRGALCSMSGGSPVSLAVYENDRLYFTKSYVVSKSYSESGDTEMTLFDRSGASLMSFISPEKAMSAVISGESDYIVSPSSDISGESWETYFTVIDLASAESGEIHFDNNKLFGAILSPSPSGRWFAAVTRGEMENARTSLLMLEPSLAGNRQTLEAVSPTGCTEPTLHQTDSYFYEQRQRADGLEEKYGVRILMGEEVLDIPEDPEHTLVPITSENFDRGDLDMCLNTLEGWMSGFPEGFFRRFISSAGGGLRLGIAENIVNADNSSGDFQAAGVTYETGAWINIAYCAETARIDDSVLDHELWHAVESLVDRSIPFDEEGWEKLLPEGFYYSNSYLSYYENTLSYQNVMLNDSADNTYFISTYGKVNGFEDRATVIQQLMKDTIKAEDQKVTAYPRIMAKIDFLADWIEPYFGYVYFESA